MAKAGHRPLDPSSPLRASGPTPGDGFTLMQRRTLSTVQDERPRPGMDSRHGRTYSPIGVGNDGREEGGAMERVSGGGLADAGHGGVSIADEELDDLGGAHDLVDHTGSRAAVNQTFIRGAVQKGGPGLLI